ncbi:SGNH/GDSL hydrolase family protein [Streptomyces sp. NPDC088794]|uniref:SGNH/GDSL hydrolase family protein n=1 Tax=Streptomyces sp. NPDC088794 TaxID=3365902 RepID=UPI00382EC453
MDTPRTRSLGGSALASGVLALACVAATAPAAGASPLHGKTHDLAYVALGDSAASGPAIPDQVDANCLRSSKNYPSLVATSLKATLTDVSCSSATTAEMTAPQGTAPPQFDALGRSTKLVTLTIGGNDIGFSTIIGTCATVSATDLAGAPCKAKYNEGGTDGVQDAVNATAPKVAEVLRDIKKRAPHARVVVVGYADIFPADGGSCTSPTAPFAAGDFAWMRDGELALNAMLKRQARRAGATYVDTYTPGVTRSVRTVMTGVAPSRTAPCSARPAATPGALSGPTHHIQGTPASRSAA